MRKLQDFLTTKGIRSVVLSLDEGDAMLSSHPGARKIPQRDQILMQMLGNMPLDGRGTVWAVNWVRVQMQSCCCCCRWHGCRY